MVHLPTLAGGLLLALASTAPAQLIAFDMESGRRSAGLFFWDDGQHPGSFVFHYGTPAWKPEYAQMVERRRAETIRLGKDFWTTLENSLPLQLGDARLPIGYWYLALHKDEDGSFHIAVFDAARLRKARIPANSPTATEPDLEFALTTRSVDEVQGELRILATAGKDDASRGTIAIRWGRYELSTPFQAVFQQSRQDLFDTCVATMLELLAEKRYEKLIRDHAHPDLLAGMSDEQIAELAEDFGSGDKPDRLARGLRHVATTRPEIADDQTTVRVEHEDLPGGDMVFAWSGDRWVLEDR